MSNRDRSMCQVAVLLGIDLFGVDSKGFRVKLQRSQSRTPKRKSRSLIGE
jgi:hypothetical protein